MYSKGTGVNTCFECIVELINDSISYYIVFNIFYRVEVICN